MEDRVDKVFTADAFTKVDSSKKFPLWIIEYVWAHKTLDLQEVMDSCDWLDVDSQPLSLEDSWRLRVASAQMFYTVKNRDLHHFEKVLNFLETTHTLLPRLVAPLRHMKLMFGLKTMVVMWMLQQEQTVDTVLKINHFFPRDLPQYQAQCTQREMFLMRRNSMDFRTFAHTLAVDKEQRKDYMKNLMEKQYGEHYAQKVEERLLQYLHELEEALPADTVVDRILKSRPVTEEEELLLDVITSDSVTVITTLRRLLHCDAASCHSVRSSQSLRHGRTEVDKDTALTLGSSDVLLRSNKDRCLREFPTGRVSEEEPAQRNNPGDSDVGRHQRSEKAGDVIHRLEVSKEQKKKKRRTRRVSGSPPQFCYKHRRWVRSILQECCDEQLPATVPSSPTLFQSSLSTSSSEDLTPSGLIQQDPPSGTPVTGQEVHSSGSFINTVGPGSSPPRGAFLLQPMVDLMDVCSDGRSSPGVSSGRASSDPLEKTSRLKQLASPEERSSAPCSTDQAQNYMNRTKQFHGAAAPHDDSNHLTPPVTTVSRLSRKYRRTVPPSADAQTQETPLTSGDLGDLSDLGVSDPAAEAQPSSSVGGQMSSASSSPSEDPVVCPTLTEDIFSFQSQHRLSSTPAPDPLVSGSETRLVQTRLSLRSQAVLLRSPFLQPVVNLIRLRPKVCVQTTGPGPGPGPGLEEHQDSSFDVNDLYSSHSSSSEDLLQHDPDYEPSVQQRRRLFLDYSCVQR